MSYMEDNSEELFRERNARFEAVIKKWRDGQLKKIQDKSKEQQQYEYHKIVREQKQKFEEEFAKQQKNIDVDAKIKKSRKTNEMRLSKMKLRFQIIENVQKEVLSRLSDVSKDEGKYVKLLEDLLMQGMTKMLEPKVEVKCLRKDAGVVKRAMERAHLLFNNICEVKTEMNLSTDYLSDEQIGGIMLTSNNGKIVCNNTLKARLDYALQLSLPEVRNMLFTKSR